MTFHFIDGPNLSSDPIIHRVDVDLDDLQRRVGHVEHVAFGGHVALTTSSQQLSSPAFTRKSARLAGKHG